MENVLVAVGLLCSLAGFAIAEHKGISLLGGLAIGFLLGPIGVTILLLMENRKAAVAASGDADASAKSAEPSPMTYLKCGACSDFTPSGGQFCQSCGVSIS